MADDSRTRSLALTTPDGVELAAALHLPAGSPNAAVLLAHPHPLHGGSMDALVPATLARDLPGAGVAALRFDFRGAGRSGGTHGGGGPEQLDVVAGVEALARLVPDVPLVVCGWSFGADVSLAVTDPRIASWVAVAPPLAVLPIDDLTAAAGADPRPTLLVVPEHDQFRAPAAAADATRSWRATTIEVVPGADHFLAGRTARVSELVRAAVDDVR